MARYRTAATQDAAVRTATGYKVFHLNTTPGAFITRVGGTSVYRTYPGSWVANVDALLCWAFVVAGVGLDMARPDLGDGGGQRDGRSGRPGRGHRCRRASGHGVARVGDHAEGEAQVTILVRAGFGRCPGCASNAHWPGLGRSHKTAPDLRG